MGTKLTKEQKRNKQKKDRARQQQKREELENKSFKRAQAISQILVGTTYGEFDPAVFVNTLNSSAQKRVESPAITALRTNEVIRKIEARTCKMVAAHMQCFRDETMWLPLVGRIYTAHEEYPQPYISSYPQELALYQKMPIEEVAMNDMKEDDKTCLGKVYFTGLYLVNGACHFAAVVTPDEDFEIYVVTPNKWIRLQNSDEMYTLYSISEVSVQQALQSEDFYSYISNVMFAAEKIEKDLTADTKNAKSLRQMIQMASADAVDEIEVMSEAVETLHKKALSAARQKASQLSDAEVQRLNRELDHLRSRLQAAETKLKNTPKNVQTPSQSIIQSTQIPIDQRMAAFFG